MLHTELVVLKFYCRGGVNCEISVFILYKEHVYFKYIYVIYISFVIFLYYLTNTYILIFQRSPALLKINIKILNYQFICKKY